MPRRRVPLLFLHLCFIALSLLITHTNTMLRTLSRPLASLRSSPLATTPCRRGFITIVQQGSVAYRLTLGKSPVELLPGLSICIPILQTVQHVDMRERSIALDSLHAFTSDNVPVVVSGSFFYRYVRHLRRGSHTDERIQSYRCEEGLFRGSRLRLQHSGHRDVSTSFQCWSICI